MRSNNTFLTLIASFCLSAIAYNAAQPVDAPVQRMEFDEMLIQPDMEVIEFDDFVIVAQAEERDILDDPGAWCFIHPDDEVCNSDVEGGETAGGDDEEGC